MLGGVNDKQDRGEVWRNLERHKSLGIHQVLVSGAQVERQTVRIPGEP